MNTYNKTTNLNNNFYYVKKPNARIVAQINEDKRFINIVTIAVCSNLKDMRRVSKTISNNFNIKNKIDTNAY